MTRDLRADAGPHPVWQHHLGKAGAASLVALLLLNWWDDRTGAAFVGTWVGWLTSKGSQFFGGNRPWADWFADWWVFALPVALSGWWHGWAWGLGLTLGWAFIYSRLLPHMEP